MSALERPVLTPSQLNALARELLEGAFPLIWVEGELSGVSRPASGHLYFTLKDARAQVRCALFKPRAQWLKFRPVDGVKVLVRARLTLYEPRGDYQLIVEHMEEAGEGALLRGFEALKARLAAEGLFDAQRKQPLPRYVRRLGLVTSPSGAAVRDVLSIVRRRFPLVEVEVLPVPVQGEGAAVQIAAMLQRADAAQRHDVLLLTRGGGSLEDLQAFNDEALARTIAALRTPLVSAVGHEIDTSISDLVADLRAATPSAAAELLVPDSAALATTLQRRRQVLEFAWRRSRQGLAQRLDQLQQRLQAQRPAARLQRGRERLESLRHRMNLQLRHELRARNEHRLRLLQRLLAQHPGARAGRLRERLQQLPVRQQAALRRLLERRRAELTALGRALAAVNPLATLSRGYAILRNEHGQVIRDPAQVEDGQPLQARLQHGDLTVRVEKR